MHPGTRGECVSSWASLNRPYCALGLSPLPAMVLGSEMAATAPAADAGGTEQGGTHSTEEMGQDLSFSNCIKDHRAQPFSARCSRRHLELA